MTTRVGRLTLSVPQVHEGKFSPELFTRFQRSEQALILALMEMVVNGVSTRKVATIAEELCGTDFHDARHTFASMLLDAGEDSKIVQELLGHSEISVTLDIYSHVGISLKRAAVDRLSDFLSGTES